MHGLWRKFCLLHRQPINCPREKPRSQERDLGQPLNVGERLLCRQRFLLLQLFEKCLHLLFALEHGKPVFQ
jgi:hypothetical protein